MKKYLLLVLVLNLFSVISFAQSGPPLPRVDLHISPLIKPYNSQLKLYNIWDRIDHDCGTGRNDAMVNNFGKNFVRQSQSNFAALAEADVRLACVALSPFQTPLLNGTLLNNQNRRETVSCLFGINADEIFLRQKDRNYFEDLVSQILYITRFSEKLNAVGDFKYKYSIVRDSLDINRSLSTDNVIAIVLTIEGAHALGHSIYIDGRITNTKEYEETVMANIDRLKGISPLVANSDTYLEQPILYITLAKQFDNGVVGNAQTFTDGQRKLLENDATIDKGITELGRKVVKRLLDTDRGRRILIDVKHMSLEGRKWYYQYIDKLEILGDSLPTLASHVGISGLSWDDPKFTSPDNDSKNNGSYISNWQQNLSKEEIIRIVKFKGLIGLSLDEQVLAGNKYFAELEKTMIGTVQRRELQYKLVAANLLRAAEIVGNKNVWDHIAIGSDFDGMYNPLDAYSTAAELPDLARDLMNFFNKPTQVFDLYSPEKVKELMFGLTAQQIVDRISSKNGMKFIKENLSKIYNAEIPAPSLTGNTTFILKGYEFAKTVSLAGDFNKWLPKKIIFARQGDQWICRTNIEPGIYDYKFIVDDKWITDPDNNNRHDDGNGNVNSVLTVK